MKACCAVGNKEEFADVGLENQILKDLFPMPAPKPPAEVRTNSKFFYTEVFDIMFAELADDFDENLIFDRKPVTVVQDSVVLEQPEKRQVQAPEPAYQQPQLQERHSDSEIYANNEVYDNMVDEAQYEEPQINSIPFTSNLVEEPKQQTSFHEPTALQPASQPFAQHREQDSSIYAPSYSQPSAIADNSFNIQVYPRSDIQLPAYRPYAVLRNELQQSTQYPMQQAQPQIVQPIYTMQRPPYAPQQAQQPSYVLQSMRNTSYMASPDLQSFSQQTSSMERQQQGYSNLQTQQLDIEQLIQKAVAANSQSINEQLAKSQDLIYQQLRIIQMQEQQLYETRQRALQLEQQQKQNQISSNQLNLLSSRSQGQPMQQLSPQSPKYSSYANAKLSLSSGFLIGSQGSRELFRIDLAQPNAIQYDEAALRIVVQGPEGPLFIKAQTHDDYEKWVRNISASLQRRISAITQKAPTTQPKLLMMLDAQTRVLFVYQNGSQTPTKQFFVENCEVTIKRDREFGVVKVRCVDGKKFSFGDRIEVCEQWQQQFESVGGIVKYIM